MKRWRSILGLVGAIAFCVGSAWAGIAVPVSPGGGTEVTAESCPTFSWSAAAGADAYRIEVYEQVTSDLVDRVTRSVLGDAVVVKEIPAPALSWTTSSGECLTRGGRYVWYVGGSKAGELADWSEGSVFQIEAAALSVEQAAAVRDVVKGYLSGDGGKDTAAAGGLPATAADAIVPSATRDVTNSFFGHQAGSTNTTGYHNTFIGVAAGYWNTTGHDNSFIGGWAGTTNSTGYANSFVGVSAGYNNTRGSRNSFIGFEAGHSNATGSGNVFLGTAAGYTENSSNKLYIDNCFTGAGCTKPLIYGEFGNRLVRIDGRLEIVSVATPSDIRYKKEIEPLDSSLEKVLQLQGVSYEWDQDKVSGAGYTQETQIGLIAQEVEKVLPELVHTDGKGYKTLSYDKLGPVLVEAVKEQQETIEKQRAAIADQQREIADLRARLERAIRTMEQRLSAVEHPVRTAGLE